MDHFKKIDEEFTCKNCGNQVKKHGPSCRNHCTKCLYSLHVDDKIPGDRSSKCEGLMEPTLIKENAKKGYIITHKCLKCGKIQDNKYSPDDNLDEMIKISLSQKLDE